MFVSQVIQVEQKEFKSFKLSTEGEGVAENGSHEAVVFAHVPKEEGITQKELMVRFTLLSRYMRTILGLWQSCQP